MMAVSKKPDTKRWNFPWNFHGKFHRIKTVELPVEFSREIPQIQNRGISRGISTESSSETKPWNFL